MQLANNELKKLTYSWLYGSANAGETVLFQVNSNLSAKQREFLIKDLIRRWNNYADLLDACKALLAFQDTDSMFRLPANIPEISNMRKAIAKAEKD